MNAKISPAPSPSPNSGSPLQIRDNSLPLSSSTKPHSPRHAGPITPPALNRTQSRFPCASLSANTRSKFATHPGIANINITSAMKIPAPCDAKAALKMPTDSKREQKENKTRYASLIFCSSSPFRITGAVRKMQAPSCSTHFLICLTAAHGRSWLRRVSMASGCAARPWPWHPCRRYSEAWDGERRRDER